MNFLPPSSLRRYFYTLLLVSLALIFAGVVFVWYRGNSALSRLGPASIRQFTASVFSEMSIFERWLGLDRPKTYLVLLLNNTEIRPGGGFIGAYAVLRLEKGRPSLVVLEGSELLDRRAATSSLQESPPAPIRKYLKVNQWYFRDSNWSPDFAVASEQTLSAYRREGGRAAGEIDAVIGLTPDVIVELLALMGPITVEGQTYSSQQFVEQLEYEVEYGHAKRGISQSDRKNIIAALAREILKRWPGELLTKWGSYYDVIEKMFAARHLMIYSLDAEIQDWLRRKQWSGEMKNTEGDYVFWVDANLGAWKTDAAIERKLDVTITTIDQEYEAAVTMNYNHRGQFDWRTTRYQTYARLFAPAGSRLIKAEVISARGRKTEIPISSIDSGSEFGRQWWGVFYSLEPQQSGSLRFTYQVAPRVEEAVDKGNYSLMVQKQLGMVNIPLTLSLDFGKRIIVAEPVLEQKNSTKFFLTAKLVNTWETRLQFESIKK